MKNTKNNTKTTVGIAIFSALAFIVALICQIIPPIAGFLSLDAKDAVIAIASFIYGPVSAVVIAFIAALIEFLTISTTGWYGFIMNFASSAAFSLIAALIYRYKRNLNGALVGFYAATALTTGVMLLLNIFVTPVYLVQFMGMPSDIASSEVMAMLPTILLPFNFAKTLMNSAIAMLLYKPVANAMKRVKLASGSLGGGGFNKNSVIILVLGSIGLIASIVILLLI